MSETAKVKSSWINQTYDKLILVVVLLALLASALFLVFSIGKDRRALVEATWEQTGSEVKKAQPIDMSPFHLIEMQIDKPFQSTQTVSRMMVSELRVTCINGECGRPIPYSASVCPFCNAKQPEVIRPEEMDSDADGITDQVEQKLGLNPLDPDDATADQDNDGFSNIEEYQAGTSMTDPKQFPSPSAKLRLGRVATTPFKFLFKGISQISQTAGGERYQLNLRSMERTFFVGLGEEVEGFKVIKYEPATNNLPPVITLQQGEKTIRLVMGKTLTQEEMVAVLVFMIDSSRYRVRVGDVIKIREQEYKVIDIKRNEVLIRDLTFNKDMTVAPLTETEKDVLRERESMRLRSESMPPSGPVVQEAPPVNGVLTTGGR